MTAVTYNLSIPNGPNNPSADQPLMQVNTNSINTLIGIDHIPFNTSIAPTTIGGYHNVIHFNNQAADPPNVAGAGELYTKSVGSPSVAALFYRPPGGATGIQLTQFLSPIGATNGYSFIPGGIILQWGIVTSAFSGSASRTGTISFSTANIAFPSACFNVQATMTGTSQSGQTMQINSISNTGFTWQFTAVPNTTSYTGFMWFAVGN